MGKDWQQKLVDSKVPPITDPNRKPYNRKNTRKWCRGKVGVEHVVIIVKDNFRSQDIPCLTGGWFFCDHYFKCSNCGKYLGKPKTCPDQE